MDYSGGELILYEARDIESVPASAVAHMWGRPAEDSRVALVETLFAGLRRHGFHGAVEVLDALYLRGELGREYGARHGIKASTVSCRRSQALRLVRALAPVPAWEANEAAAKALGVGLPRDLAPLYRRYWGRPSQQRLANELGVSQGRVLHHLTWLDRQRPETEVAQGFKLLRSIRGRVRTTGWVYGAETETGDPPNS